jgi:hypothetical protein
MADVLTGSRFAQITPDDHAGSVWIASILCLIYSVLTLALRGHLRLRIYGLDDYIALAATVSNNAPTTAVSHRLIGAADHPGGRGDCNNGWTTPWTGKDSTPPPSRRVDKGQPSKQGSLRQHCDESLMWAGNIHRTDTVHPLCRCGESLDVDFNDETF